MPVEEHKPRKTLRTASKTASRRTANLGCIKKCKMDYAMGDIDEIELAECIKKCQGKAA